MQILQIFIIGVAILAGAIALNYIASLLSLVSWYEFLKNPSRLSVASMIWLFLLYPFALGFIAYCAFKLVAK